MLTVAEIIPPDATVLSDAEQYEQDLSPQDALVLASVLASLRQTGEEKRCFLNRNAKDFNTPAVKQLLSAHNCTMIPKFDDGLRFIQREA